MIRNGRCGGRHSLCLANATSPDGSCRRYQTALPLQGRYVPLLSTPLPFRGLRTVWPAVGEPRGGGTARVEKECDQKTLDAGNRTRGYGEDQGDEERNL
jgi:hypothetical protein